MRKASILFIVLALFTTPIFSQTPTFKWAAAMGANSFDAGFAITTDATGNVYSTGYFQFTVDFDPGIGTFNLTTLGPTDTYVQKLDANGNFLWAVQIGGGTNTSGFTITTDAAGNVYIGGIFSGTTDFDPGTGIFNLTAKGTNDGFVLKLDTNGNLLWVVQVGGFGFDKVNSVTTHNGGDVYISGSFSDTVDFDPGTGTNELISAGAQDIFVLKLKNSGAFKWVNQVGSLTDDVGGTLVAKDGVVISTGYFQGTADFNPATGTNNLTSAGNQDAYIQKLDTAGSFLWAVNMGGVGTDGGSSITVDASGNIFSAGYFEGTADFDPGSGTQNLTSNGLFDIYIQKLDANGNLLWVNSTGGIKYDVIYDLVLDAANNIYTVGSFEDVVDFDPGADTSSLTAAGSTDAYIQELDANGNYIWAGKIGASFADVAYSIAKDNNGYIYTTGSFSETVDFDPGAGTFDLTANGQFDIFIQKLAPQGVGLSENNLFKDVLIYPNPSHGNVNIIGLTPNVKLKITDLTGRLIFEKENVSTNMITVDLKAQPSGIYFVEITSGKSRQNYKLILN